MTPLTDEEIDYLKREAEHEISQSFRYVVVKASKLMRLLQEREAMLEALKLLHDETKDYIELNHIGDP